MSSEDKTIVSAKGRVMDGDGNINKFGVIDSVKLESFDPKTDSIKIRVDDSNVPGFWMEVNIRFLNLEKWVNKMKKMSEDEYDSSDDEENGEYIDHG
jgi:hypothetical protein